MDLTQGVTMEDEIKQMLYRHMQREKDIQRRFKDNKTDSLYEDFLDHSKVDNVELVDHDIS
jgi:hypothetical protein